MARGNRSRISAGVTTLGSRGCSSRRWRSNTLPVIGAMTFRAVVMFFGELPTRTAVRTAGAIALSNKAG